MNKLIKNYTTTIKASKTITEIQELLAKNGARGIATEYDAQGRITDVFFKIILNEKELPFRLPVKTDKVAAVLRESGFSRYASHAEDIAWRICKTWLEAQLTLINLEQAKLEEVFLPYLVMPGNKSLYETMQQKNFLLPG